MKKFFIPCLLLLCMIFSATSVKAADLFTGNPVIGVWEFENQAAISNELLTISGSSVNKASSWIQGFLEIVLKRTNETKNRFTVVNYKKQKELVENKIWLNGGMVDTNDEAYKLILSVNFFVDGSLTGISTKPTTPADIEHGLLGSIKTEKRTVIANVIFNFTDAHTGEIITGFDGVGKSSVANAVLQINERGEEYYETDNSNDTSVINPTPNEDKTTNVFKHTIKIGTEQYSLVQVQNAVRKAVIDAVRNKKYGLVAVLNGTAKEGRF